MLSNVPFSLAYLLSSLQSLPRSSGIYFLSSKPPPPPINPHPPFIKGEALCHWRHQTSVRNHSFQLYTFSIIMAAITAAKRSITLSKTFQNLLSSPARPVTASGSVFARSFNANAQIRESEDDRDIDVDHRSGDGSVSRRRVDGFPAYISDVMDPFVPRTVSHLMNMMNSIFDGPFQSSARGAGGLRRGWDAREDKEALYLRVDMPGLGKENVKVSAEQGTLFIKAEGEAEAGEEESHRRYSSRIDLAPELYKLDAIRAEMKNGVLKIVVPKVKAEERKDVFQINIE